MKGGLSPWTFLEVLSVASNTFCPVAHLEASSGLPAEVEGDESGDGAEAGNSGGVVVLAVVQQGAACPELTPECIWGPASTRRFSS